MNQGAINLTDARNSAVRIFCYIIIRNVTFTHNS